jgi:hypothetical protein
MDIAAGVSNFHELSGDDVNRSARSTPDDVRSTNGRGVVARRFARGEGLTRRSGNADAKHCVRILTAAAEEPRLYEIEWR